MNRKLIYGIFILMFLLGLNMSSALMVINSGSNNITISSLEKGLVGHWTLDETSYNSNTNRVDDLSPYNNHGTNYGATFTTDRFGNANSSMSFNNANNYLNCGNDASLMPSSITVSAWVKVTDTSSWMVINKAAGGTSGSYYMYGDNLVATWSIFAAGGTRYNAAMGSLEYNGWTHIVGTFDSATGNMYGYNNGNLIGSRSGASLGSNTANVLIGRYTSGYYLGGYVDDVRIYNRALSSEEVKLLYDSYKPQASGTSLNKGLIGHWSLKEQDFNEGTTNLVPYSDYSDKNYGQEYTASCWGGDAAKMYFYSSGGYNNLPYKKMTKTTAGTGGCYISMHSGIPIKNDTTYVVSGWVKASRPVYVSGYFLSINRPLDNAYRLGTAQTLTTDWVRYSWIYNAGSGHAGTYLSRDIIYIDDDLPLDIYWSGFQVEERDSLSAYVNGVRASKIEDLSPYGLSATNNGATIGSESTSFNGAGNYIQVNDDSALDLTNEVTISSWINPNTLHDGGILTKKPTSGTAYNYYYRLTAAGGINFGVTLGTTLRVYSANTQLSPGMWSHIVGTYDGTSLKLYVDGTYFGKADYSGTMTPTDNYLIIGSEYIGYRPFNGNISNVKIYNRALSATEVQQLYNQGR